MSAPERSAHRWMKVAEAAAYAQIGKRIIYREIKAGRLRAAVIGGRRDYRLLPAWLGEWLIATSTPREVIRRVS